jgi:hypothetical protein
VLDLLNTYEVFINEGATKNDDFEYFFTTDFDVTYILGFSNASYLFKTECLECGNIYGFRFYPLGKKSKRDPKINLTIIKTIQKFIDQYNFPIIYVCDISSGEGLGRLHLFDRWFQLFSNGNYLKNQQVFQTPFQKIPIGIISSSSDSNFNRYLDEIDYTWMG